MVTLSLTKEAKIYNGEKTVSSISGAGKTTATWKRMKLEYSLTRYTKINSKWLRELNVRLDTIKLLEENIGRTLFDINHSKIFFDPPPREMERKTKINKWDLMKLKKKKDMEGVYKGVIMMMKHKVSTIAWHKYRRHYFYCILQHRDPA